MNSTVNQGKRPYYHDIDILRGFLMSLGVVLHAGFYLSPTLRGPQIDVGVSSSLYEYLVQAIMLFRMEAFFIVAGFFAAMLGERYSATAILYRRAIKLLVPMLFCGLTFNFIIGFLAWPGDFDRSPLSANYWLSGQWLEHLWFLPILFVYTLVFTLVGHYTGLLKAKAGPSRSAPAMLTLIYLAYPLAVFVCYRINWRLDLWPWQGSVLGLFWLPHLFIYAPAFVLGVVLWKLGALRALTRGPVLWVHGLLAAVFAYLAFMVGADQGAGSAVGRVREFFVYGIALPLSFLIMGLFSLLFSRPTKWGKFSSEFSYTLYLLHMPVLVCIATAMSFLDVPSAHLAFVIFVVVTVALCLLAHRLVRKSKALSLLLNGDVRQAV